MKRENYDPAIPFLFGKSLGLFSTTNIVRKILFQTVNNKKFQYMIIGIIIISGI